MSRSAAPWVLFAVAIALAIRDAVAALHEQLPEEAHLDFGVGIHYGEAVLGWIGTEKRLEYTAIGDSINTAKRIQEAQSQLQSIPDVRADKVAELKGRIENGTYEAKADQIAEKMIHVVSQPVIVNGRQAVVSASIGIALYPDQGEEIDQLIKQADDAMYRVKNTGKNEFGFADTTIKCPPVPTTGMGK